MIQQAAGRGARPWPAPAFKASSSFYSGIETKSRRPARASRVGAQSGHVRPPRLNDGIQDSPGLLGFTAADREAMAAGQDIGKHIAIGLELRRRRRRLKSHRLAAIGVVGAGAGETKLGREWAIDADQHFVRTRVVAGGLMIGWAEAQDHALAPSRKRLAGPEPDPHALPAFIVDSQEHFGEGLRATPRVDS